MGGDAVTWEVVRLDTPDGDALDQLSVAILYTASQTQAPRWFGVELAKLPTDLFVYQEILLDTRPDLVIETGTFKGGSAHFLQSILGMLGHGQVITIDVGRDETVAQTPGVTYFVGRSATHPDLVAEIHALARGQRTMVILDSDHASEHVLAELDAYAPLVTPGCYLIVEDTHFVNNGPRVALEQWLPQHPEFTVDQSRERYGLTLNRGGYLQRS